MFPLSLHLLRDTYIGFMPWLLWIILKWSWECRCLLDILILIHWICTQKWDYWTIWQFWFYFPVFQFYFPSSPYMIPDWFQRKNSKGHDWKPWAPGWRTIPETENELHTWAWACCDLLQLFHVQTLGQVHFRERKRDCKRLLLKYLSLTKIFNSSELLNILSYID